MTSGDRPAGEATGADVRTFLIADVRGYTRFTQEQGDEEAARLAARFAQLAREAIEFHGGELLELRGDEALGVFKSARDALRGAVELQRRVRTRTDGVAALPLGVGIGLDAGEAVPVEGGYRGGALNLAARLCSQAAPGEILTSDTVVSLARKVDGIRYVERGAQRFKGLEEPVRVIEVTSEEALPPVPSTRLSGLRRFRRRNLTRRKVAGLIGIAIVAATAAVLAVAAMSGTAVPGRDAPTRVALLASGDPDDAISVQMTEGLLRAERTYGLETETLQFDDFDTSPVALQRLSSAIGEGDFDLVLTWGGGPVLTVLADDLRKHPDTHFVFVDNPELRRIEELSNATAVSFDVKPASHLGGYLAALVSKTGRTSAVGGIPFVVEELIRGFEEGGRSARPGARFRADYSHTFGDPPTCERLANDQIDEGSEVVFAVAGPCGLGALSAASTRGVWGVGVDSDQSYLGSHILASVVKRFDRAVELAVRRHLDGTLPGGGTVDLGIADDAVGLVGINPKVTPAVRMKLADETARIRAKDGAEGS